METSMGTIKIELFEDKAPITVKNFLGYVDDKFYDGTDLPPRHRQLHDPGRRLRPGRRHQRGSQGEEDQATPIKNESGNGLSNKRGTIAMARTNDPDSATAQFFINVKDNDFLDKAERDSAGYCVFGKVIEGMDVVDKIKAVKTGTERRPRGRAGRGRRHQVRPPATSDIVIESIRVDEAE